MEKEKQTQQKPNPRTYNISSEQLMDIMRYLMSRPYAEVVKLMNMLSTLAPQSKGVNSNDGKNNLDKYTGILFELKIGLNKNNAIVIDYGGKPVGKIREALKGYPYHGNLCAAVINHANSVGKKLQDDIKQLIQKV